MTGIDALLTPLQLRGCRLANRVAMAPMSRYVSQGGVPSDAVASYYARRAATGLGLIVTEGVGIAHQAAVDHPGVPRLHGEAALAGWRKVVDAVHDSGGVIWPQLWHQGVMWNVEYEGGQHGAMRRQRGRQVAPCGHTSTV